MCRQAGGGEPLAWGTARVGNTAQNSGGRQAGMWGGSSTPLLPAIAGCSLSLSWLSSDSLLCSPASTASAVVGTATSTPSTLQPLLQHHQDTATLLPKKLQLSPALALQQPFDPRCSNAAEDAFFAQALGLSVVQTYSKSSREKPQKKQDIGQLSEDYQKSGMHPHFFLRNANPVQACCASCTHRWIKLLAGGWELKEGILYFSPCDL